MQPFRMLNDSRPKAAAKLLKRLVYNEGFEVSLANCQLLTSQMLGYSSWADMSASLGKFEPSLDDAFVPDSVRRERLSHYVSVLRSHGLPEGAASAAAAGIDLTNRTFPATPEAIPTLRALTYDDATVYHPARLARAMLDATRLTGVDDWGAAAHKLLQPVTRWITAPCETPGTYSLVTLNSMVDTIYGWGDRLVIDASRMTPPASMASLSGWDARLLLGTWRTGNGLYVHFGKGEFASPYPGCSIEGCYIDFQDGEDLEGEPDGGVDAFLMFVASNDLPRGNGLRPEVNLASNVRVSDYILKLQSADGLVTDGPVKMVPSQEDAQRIPALDAIATTMVPAVLSAVRQFAETGANSPVHVHSDFLNDGDPFTSDEDYQPIANSYAKEVFFLSGDRTLPNRVDMNPGGRAWSDYYRDLAKLHPIDAAEIAARFEAMADAALVEAAPSLE